MTAAVLRALLLVCTLVGAAAVAAALTRPVVRVALSGELAAVAAAQAPAASKLDEESIRASAARPMFRADRRRSSVSYSGTRTATPQTRASAAVPKPVLAISGIIWGPEPAALVEGVPGSEGSVVLRRGESMGGIRVVRIEGERVVIRGLDTTWTLPLRNPWP